MSEKREYPEWMGKMRGLYADELQEFLDGPVVARIATVDSKGDPYVTPVWQEWDGECNVDYPAGEDDIRATLASLPALLGVLRP